MISIIIPVYNAERSLSVCLDSVLSQTVQDWECILVDDGSRDSSGKLCDDYALHDSRFKVLHKANGGASSARNLGIEKAQGDWVAFVDADDYLLENYLEILQQEFSDDMLIVTGFQGFGDLDDIVSPCKMEYVDIEKGLGRLWGYSDEKFLYWYVWCKLFNLAKIRKYHICFNEDLFYGEDFCFVLDYISHVSKIGLVPGHSYMHEYILKGRNIRYKFSPDQLEQHFLVHEEKFDQLEGRCNFHFVKVKASVYTRFFYNFQGFLSGLQSYPQFRATCKSLVESEWGQEFLSKVFLSRKQYYKTMLKLKFPALWYIKKQISTYHSGR